jgi:hypothetical protein
MDSLQLKSTIIVGGKLQSVGSHRFQYNIFTNFITVVGVPLEYGKPGITIRQEIYAKHGTTHPARKHPKGQKRKRQPGRGEGNPPKPRPKGKVKEAETSEWDGSGSESESDNTSHKRLHVSPRKTRARAGYTKPEVSLALENFTDLEEIATTLMVVSPPPEAESSANAAPNAFGPLSSGKSQLDFLNAKGWLSGMFPSKARLDTSQPIEFSGINTKLVTELAGPAWSSNSCWLDSSMEAIYSALVYHKGFKDLETLVSGDEASDSPSLIYSLYLACKFRLHKGLHEFQESRHGAAQELTELRDNFRQKLHLVGAANGKIGQTQGTTVSFKFYFKIYRRVDLISAYLGMVGIPPAFQIDASE